MKTLMPGCALLKDQAHVCRTVFNLYTELASTSMKRHVYSIAGFMFVRMVFQEFAPYIKAICPHRNVAFLPGDLLTDGMRPIMTYIEDIILKEDPDDPVKSERGTFYPPFHVPSLEGTFVTNTACFISRLAKFEVQCQRCFRGVPRSIFFNIGAQDAGLHIVKRFASMVIGKLCDDRRSSVEDIYQGAFLILPVLARERLLHGTVLYWIYFSLFYALGSVANRCCVSDNLRAAVREEKDLSKLKRQLIAWMIQRFSVMFQHLAILGPGDEPRECLDAALSLTDPTYPKVRESIEKRREAFVNLLLSRVTQGERICLSDLLSRADSKHEHIIIALQSYADKFTDEI